MRLLFGIIVISFLTQPVIAQISTWSTNPLTGQTQVQRSDPYGRNTGTTTYSTNPLTGQVQGQHSDPYGRGTGTSV